MAFLPVAMVAGSLLSAGASVVSGISSIQQGNYQNQVAKNNAIIAEKNAAAAEVASQQRQQRSDIEYGAQVGEATAQQGASGFDILGRTQVMARNTTRAAGRGAAVDIRTEGWNQAQAGMQEAQNFRVQGAAAKAQGLASGIGSFLQAGASVANAFGGTKSLASSRAGGRRPWNQSPNWYGRG